MSYQQINNVTFYYECFGCKDNSIVFISGYTCDHNLWRCLAKKFATKHQVLIFDNQAAGQTKDDNCELSVWGMAENIKGLIDSLGIIKPHIIAYAMGANIAQAYAILFPKEVRQLILLSATSKWSQQALDYVDHLYNLKAAKDEEYFEFLYSGCFSNSYRHKVSLADFRKLIDSAPEVQPLNDAKRQIEVLKNFYVTDEDLSKISVPTIVLSPQEDMLATVADGQILVKKIGQKAKQIVIPNFGHAILMEDEDCELIAKIIESNLN